jgi:hypothetical protein
MVQGDTDQRWCGRGRLEMVQGDTDQRWCGRRIQARDGAAGIRG